MRCGVYVHVPYCSRKCDYCAFHSVTQWSAHAQRVLIDKIIADAALFASTGSTRSTSPRTANARAVGCEQIRAARAPAPLSPASHTLRADLPAIAAKTLYIGGGTPSVLSRGQLVRLVDGVTAHLGVPREITCEANPESAGAAFLEEAAGAGITRISVGVQSLSSELARRIGRNPTSVEVLEKIRRRWDGLLSADLIVGIPGQTTPEVVSDIRILAGLGFGHASIYDLSVDPGTPLWRKANSGAFRIPDDGPDWRRVCDAFDAAGFIRYEVSNFALPHQEAQHNLGYWRAEPYLGLGPSATSTLPVEAATLRFDQPTNHARFLLGHPLYDVSPEHLDHETLATEFLMLGLRTAEGVSFDRFRKRFGLDLRARYGDAIDTLCTRNLLVASADALRPTSRGMDILNSVLVDLLDQT